MTSSQGEPPSKDKTPVELEAVLQHYGQRRGYLIVQVALCLTASFVIGVNGMAFVFFAYQPDYQCSQVDNVTELEAHLPDDVTNVTLDDITYGQCNIDVTSNTSGTTSTTHSLPCVAGFNFSVPSTTSIVTEWRLVCEKTALTQLTQAGQSFSQALGSLLSSMLADRYGRSKMYTCCALLTMIFNLALSFAGSYGVFLFFRIAGGFFQSGMINAAYTLLMETLPQRWRFLASVLDSFLWEFSCVFLAAVAYSLQGVSWRYLTAANAAMFAYSLLLPCVLDESLQWLIATGRIEAARKVVKRACRVDPKDLNEFLSTLREHGCTEAANEEPLTKGPTSPEQAVDQEVSREGFLSDSHTPQEEGRGVQGHDGKDVKCGGEGGGGEEGAGSEVEQPFSARYTILDLFRHRVVLVPFLVCIFVWMTSNTYYTAVMLGSASLSGNRFLNFSLLSLVQIPSTLLALILIPRFNRRPLAFVYGMIAGMFLILSVALVALGGTGVTLTLGTVAQNVGMFSLAGSYILLFVYYMEVFPTAMRAVGAGTIAAVIKVTDTAAPFLLVWAEETPWAPGVLVGCLCCLASLCIWLLPETRNRKLPDTIEEIQAQNNETSSASVQPKNMPQVN